MLVCVRYVRFLIILDFSLFVKLQNIKKKHIFKIFYFKLIKNSYGQCSQMVWNNCTLEQSISSPVPLNIES